jgi:hypothetical protein
MSLNDCLMRWENTVERGVGSQQTHNHREFTPFQEVESAAKPICQRKIPKLIYLALCEGGEMLRSGLRSRIRIILGSRIRICIIIVEFQKL